MERGLTWTITLLPEEEASEAAPTRSSSVIYRPGQTLAQAVYLSGLAQPPVLCSGLGRCGRCRMRILDDNVPTTADLAVLTPEELATGLRLACRHSPRPGMRVQLPPGTLSPQQLWKHVSAVAMRSEPKPPEHDGPPVEGDDSGTLFVCPVDVEHAHDAPEYWTTAMLAVDLGTTSLAWQLLGANHEWPDAVAQVLWHGSMVNPQMGAGSDIVARIAAAANPEGLHALHSLTLNTLRSLCDSAERVLNSMDSTPGKNSVRHICLAANPAQSALALGKDCRSLGSAPYTLPYDGGHWEELPHLPPLWFPPQLSPFVGGDISAGYAALALNPERHPPHYPFLLADLGTNGEFLLALSPDTAFSASVALGPALEGTGLRHGTEARPGAVTAFHLTPAGLEAVRMPASGTLGNAPCAGITGTGYLSLLHVLRNADAMDQDGRFTRRQGSPAARFLSPQQDSEAAEAWIALPLSLRLYASDVEEILKVKAAFSLGLQRLLAEAGIAFSDVAEVFIAGAMGTHVDLYALENLGFFPPGGVTRLHAAGNTSLTGAGVLLQHARSRTALLEWAQTVKNLNLASDPSFIRDFPEHMRFSW